MMAVLRDSIIKSIKQEYAEFFQLTRNREPKTILNFILILSEKSDIAVFLSLTGIFQSLLLQRSYSDEEGITKETLQLWKLVKTN